MNFITLQVEGINQEGNRIIIKSGGRSYSFFQTKQDGTESRAYQDYIREKVQIGQSYSFGVSETPGQTKDGKPITYRNIGVISPARQQEAPSDAPQSPVSTSNPNIAPNYQNTLETQQKLILEELKAIRKLLEKDEIPIVGEETKIEDIQF